MRKRIPDMLVVVPLAFFFLVSTTRSIANAQPVVHFGLPDYADLGLVRAAVDAGSAEAINDQTNLTASLNYVSLAVSALSTGTAFTNISSTTVDIADTIDKLHTLLDAAQADSLGALANTLSPLDFSATRTSLANLRAQLSMLDAQAATPIMQPTDYVDFACAVSSRAKALVAELRAQAVAQETVLLDNLTTINARESQLVQLSSQLSKVLQLEHDTEAALVKDLDRPFIEFTGLPIIINTILQTLLASEGNITFLVPDVDDTIPAIEAVANRVSRRLIEIGDLITNLDIALSIPSLPSRWTTDAEVSSSAFYTLAFSGRSFDYPYTEIDGPFLLGTLSIHNRITPGAGGDTTSAVVQFSVHRTVNDPVIGEQPTDATVAQNMSYTATLNTDDPVASADYFTIPSLGIRTFIVEEDTAAFQVFGQYDSPLRIIAVIPAPDSTGWVEQSAFALNVSGGTGSGVYAPGEQVQIEASVPDGKEFLRWEGDAQYLASAVEARTTVEMPNNTVSVRALTQAVKLSFTLQVKGGTGSGMYIEGTEVGILPVVPPGERFVAWGGDVDAISKPGAPETTVLVTRDLIVEAQFVASDDCPNDPLKTVPGVCGCGNTDGDVDGDGHLDCIDPCPRSIITATIVINGCDSGVPNQMSSNGCSLADRITEAAARARNHGAFVSKVADLTNTWVQHGVMSGNQKGQVQRCAAHAPVP